MKYMSLDGKVIGEYTEDAEEQTVMMLPYEHLKVSDLDAVIRCAASVCFEEFPGTFAFPITVRLGKKRKRFFVMRGSNRELIRRGYMTQGEANRLEGNDVYLVKRRADGSERVICVTPK